jgi:hypothetical protein
MFKKTANLFKTITKDPKTFVTNILYGNTNLPFSFREMLKKIGNENITSLVIIRAPISNSLMSVMNAFTGFQLKEKIKQSPYDSLFHLKLRINGKYDLEKEEVPQLRPCKNVAEQETMSIGSFNSTTINQFIENAIKHMSMKQFLHYNGSNNNCQVFVLNILHGNGIHNSQCDEFIKQDTTFVFEHNSFLRKLMNTGTDIKRATVQLTEGTGIKQKKKKKLTTVSNNQIVSMCIKLEIPLEGVFMKDELHTGLKDGNYVMNLQNHNQGGSHWIAFIKRAGKVYYNDSFGAPPPQNEYELFKSENDFVYYNTHIHQDIDSTACGYWAIYFLYYMTKTKGNLLANFQKFNKTFNSKDTKANELKLQESIQKIM